MDYAATVPYWSRGQSGIPAALAISPKFRIATATNDTVACGEEILWGAPGINGVRQEDSVRPAEQITDYRGYWGVIVRGNLCVNCSGQARMTTNFYQKISFAQITDGSSNTMVIGEKQLNPAEYDIGAWHDDKGWSAGWDPDTMRSTSCTMGPDNERGEALIAYRFGSAHAGVMNAGFADASVRALSYELDPEVFNRIGHRADEEQIDWGT